jgi:YHS domain-containing protein
VSGVVFPIGDTSAHREVGGKTVYFCCEKCAMYFAEHADQVAAARGIEATR